MKINRTPATATFPCVTVVPATSWAQVDEAWPRSAIMYGYFPSIGGSTAVPNADSPIGVDASNVIGSLKGAFTSTLAGQQGFMGHLE